MKYPHSLRNWSLVQLPLDPMHSIWMTVYRNNSISVLVCATLPDATSTDTNRLGAKSIRYFRRVPSWCESPLRKVIQDFHVHRPASWP